MEILQKEQVNKKLQRDSGRKTYIEHGELWQDGPKLFVKRVLRELDLPHVKTPYATYFEIFMDHLVNSGLPGWFRDNGTSHTVGVLRCVLDNTMSKKSAAVGTGDIAFSPLVDMAAERWGWVDVDEQMDETSRLCAFPTATPHGEKAKIK